MKVAATNLPDSSSVFPYLADNSIAALDDVSKSLNPTPDEVSNVPKEITASSLNLVVCCIDLANSVNFDTAKELFIPVDFKAKENLFATSWASVIFSITFFRIKTVPAIAAAAPIVDAFIF